MDQNSECWEDLFMHLKKWFVRINKSQNIMFKALLTLILTLGLFVPFLFADQGHERGRQSSDRHDQGRGNWHANRHYYHNGVWNRNGWYGWGVQMPVYADGVLVASLPPDSTAVIVSGVPYFYGNGMYFRQMAAGGYAVVSIN